MRWNLQHINSPFLIWLGYLIYFKTELSIPLIVFLQLFKIILALLIGIGVSKCKLYALNEFAKEEIEFQY